MTLIGVPLSNEASWTHSIIPPFCQGVMLSGWGSSGELWAELARRLARERQARGDNLTLLTYGEAVTREWSKVAG